MTLPVSPSPQKENEIDHLLLDEYDRLQNQLRRVQNERQRQANDTTVKLKKDRNELEWLSKENEDLHTWLNLLNSDQNKQKDSKIIAELKRILAEQDSIQEKIYENRDENDKLDREIRKLEKQIRQKQQEKNERTRGEKQTGELLASLEERIQLMEKHLHSKNNKFCKTLKENEKLRAEIDDKRLERRSFVKLQQKLTEQLNSTNKLKMEMTEKATSAYEQREEAVKRKALILEREENGRIAFELERKTLQRIIDHNEQLEKFMRTKGNDRVEWKREAEETSFRRGSAGKMAQKQRKLQFDQFAKAERQLKEITQVDQLEDVIGVYQRREEENFAEFKYVSELHNQVENLQETISSIKRNIEACKMEKESHEQKQQAVMHQLEIQMNGDKSLADADELRLTQIRKILDQIKTQLKALVEKLGCDVKQLSDQLDDEKDDITERNMMIYLGALERRVDQLLCIRSYRLLKIDEKETEVHTSITDEYTNLTDSQHISKHYPIALPSVRDTDEVDSTSGSSVRPLTYAELTDRSRAELKRYAIRMPKSGQTRS